jgi:hypothetical protein
MKTSFLTLVFFLVTLPLLAQNRTTPKYMFMNGFDFQLENIDKLKYVGHFNIYIPVSESKKWGFNVGLLKLNNLNNDSIARYQQDNVLSNPLDHLVVGSSYNQQYNKYTTKTSVSTYSAYFQVLRKIIFTSDVSLSVHGHAELLISKISSTTTIDTIATRNILIENASQIPLSSDITPYLIKYKSNNYSSAAGNFGLGVTLDYNFNNQFSLFAQGTAGWSLEHPSNASTGNIGYDGYQKNWFYLFRTYFQYNTSATANTQLLIGTDFRGILGQVPFNSIYLGVNLDIENITNLITK